MYYPSNIIFVITQKMVFFPDLIVLHISLILLYIKHNWKTLNPRTHNISTFPYNSFTHISLNTVKSVVLLTLTMYAVLLWLHCLKHSL